MSALSECPESMKQLRTLAGQMLNFESPVFLFPLWVIQSRLWKCSSSYSLPFGYFLSFYSFFETYTFQNVPYDLFLRENDVLYVESNNLNYLDPILSHTVDG